MGIQEHGVVLGFGEIPPGKTSRESPSLERFGLDFGKIRPERQGGSLHTWRDLGWIVRKIPPKNGCPKFHKIPWDPEGRQQE